MFEEKSNTSGFLLGLLTGGIIGGLAALLYAPKSGRELRQDISIKKDELLEDADRYMENAKHKASDLISEGRKAAVNFLDETKNKAEQGSENVEKALNQGKDKLSDEIHKMKEPGKTGGGTYSDERNKPRH